jgi:hypothetical protein
MEEVTRHLDGTYFAWIGGTDPGGCSTTGFRDPVILIEFDHQAPARFATHSRDARSHSHSGPDAKRQRLRKRPAPASHYAQHPHPASTGGN